MTTFATDAADRVLTTRRVPWRSKDLPAIAIYTLDEHVDPASYDTAPRVLVRDVEVAIEAARLADVDVDDALDAIALQIELAMDSDQTLGDAAGRVVLASTEMNVLERGNEEPIGVVRMVYVARYRTDALATDAPTTHRRTLIRKAVQARLISAAANIFGDFATAGVQIDLGGLQAEADQTAGLVTLPTS